jgi:dTDP-4-amino-4,6-dideoxygalactose transaminase
MSKTSDPYEVVRAFEQCVAQFAGSKYAVSVDTCTAALFLCCHYLKVQEVTIPKHTYVSVPCSIIQAGGKVKFIDLKWRGLYQLYPYPIWDSALRFKRDMYIPGSYYCVSFHYKKQMPIGRGGMILTDNAEAVEWFKQARFNGRHEKPILEDKFEMLGWNMYMDPERAARGLCMMLNIEDYEKNEEDIYPDLSQFPIYTK